MVLKSYRRVFAVFFDKKIGALYLVFSIARIPGEIFGYIVLNAGRPAVIIAP